jgi:hypothetical protein
VYNKCFYVGDSSIVGSSRDWKKGRGTGQYGMYNEL